MESVNIVLSGGLGNQMFQIASSYAHAKRNGVKLNILKQKRMDDGRPLYWESVLSNWKDCQVNSLPDCFVWNETETTTFTGFPPTNQKHLLLTTYLQSPKYFVGAESDIVSRFQPSPEIVSRIQTKYGSLLRMKENAVVIHARRTDYLKTQGHINFHGPLTPAYYKEAMNQISEKVKNPHFILVSDDPSFWWTNISEFPALQNSAFTIVTEQDEILSLYFFSQFKHFIIANSSFSWWFAWLAGQREPTLTFAPKNWFGPSGPKGRDIICDHWIQI